MVAAPGAAAQILTEVGAFPERRLRADLVAAQCWACCRHDPRFPVGLRDAADAPWALIGRGDPALLERLEPAGSVTVLAWKRGTPPSRSATSGGSNCGAVQARIRRFSSSAMLVTGAAVMGSMVGPPCGRPPGEPWELP